MVNLSQVATTKKAEKNDYKAILKIEDNFEIEVLNHQMFKIELIDMLKTKQKKKTKNEQKSKNHENQKLSGKKKVNPRSPGVILSRKIIRF